MTFVSCISDYICVCCVAQALDPEYNLGGPTLGTKSGQLGKMGAADSKGGDLGEEDSDEEWKGRAKRNAFGGEDAQFDRADAKGESSRRGRGSEDDSRGRKGSGGADRKGGGRGQDEDVQVMKF